MAVASLLGNRLRDLSNVIIAIILDRLHVHLDQVWNPLAAVLLVEGVIVIAMSATHIVVGIFLQSLSRSCSSRTSTTLCLILLESLEVLVLAEVSILSPLVALLLCMAM